MNSESETKSNEGSLSSSQKRFKIINNTNISSDDVLSKNSETNNEQNPENVPFLGRKSPESVTDTDNEEIIMAVYWKNGKLGAAHFNTVSSELHILNEITDSKPEHSMLKNIFRQVRPVIVIADIRSQEHFSKSLKSLASTLGWDSSTNLTRSDSLDMASSNCRIYFLPNDEFNYESCKRRIYLLRLPNEPENSSEDDHRNFLNSIINFHNLLTVHALGALLKYLDKNWCRLNIDNNAMPTFLSLNNISLKDIVNMDDESYQALQVFKKLPHPSNFKKGTAQSAKEGLSLFSLYNKCCSKIGMQHLRALMQHPTNDPNILEARYDTIDFCNHPGNEEIIRSVCSSLKHIKNVNGILTKIKGLRASPYEWKCLFNTLYNGLLICEYCEKKQGYSTLIDSLGSRNNHDLFQVAHHMNTVVDFDLSKIQGKFTVKVGVDPELDQKKQKMMGLHGLMSSTATIELEKLPQFIEECTMIYLPNLGYLLGVKTWKANLTREEKELPDLKFMFQNHDYIHYKSKGCEELDMLIGDTHPEILAHEMRIMMRLTKFILQHLHALSTLIKSCAELDCLIAIAKTCKENDYKRPTITSSTLIDIKNGRHPLLELCSNNFVPNSTLSSPESQLITILTGPNACGKSIYMKQVALIVYMTHIGSFVPAEAATIGLVDCIFTRIQTVEDISTRMSAFFIDLRQISLSIQESTNKSLVIIDEFGKGTSEVDGLALLAACINNFIYRQENSPHVFVSTHFQGVKQYLMSSYLPSNCLKFETLEYVIQEKDLIFLYKLKDGIADSSLAHQVAEMVGININIIKRARNVFEYLQFQTNAPLSDTKLTQYSHSQEIINNVKKILSKEENWTVDTIKRSLRK